jgi:GH25 family lysozyme M1 (1,4-beta-N-acetylmuramidase)
MNWKKEYKKAGILFCVLGMMVLCLQPLKVHAASKIKGFDVSSQNGEIDWEAVAESGMDFVMIRTGEGQAPDRDAQFEKNYNGAVAAGLKVGVYHVCCVRTAEAAKKEAEYCLEILDGRDLDYPVAYDIEKAGCFADGRQNTTAIAKAFCEVISAAGYTPMIYSSTSYLNDYFDWTKLAGYKVWAADYRGVKPTLTVPVDIWQYTNVGTVAGANTDQGVCDLDDSYMEASGVKFVEKSIQMKKGSTTTAKVKLSPGGCTDSVVFSSSNKKVVTVGKTTGKLRAKAKGKAVITAKTGSGKSAKIRVVVK